MKKRKTGIYTIDIIWSYLTKKYYHSQQDCDKDHVKFYRKEKLERLNKYGNGNL
jgi:hypothetical protein